MTYEEAILSEVSRSEARREIEKHGFDWEEFVIDNGDHDAYLGKDVLGWLGY